MRLLTSALELSAEDGELGYVQGMNVLLAPFLYVMPEVDAFYAFERFVKMHLPRYVYPSLDGAHDGARLLDEVLEIVDPELYQYVQRKRKRVGRREEREWESDKVV
eukprot:TRINITY_DN5168_c0_g2_i2.p3 TRINITY_DN5168_c0_g2~~TRINITY_DN5168_c0_g2_i2.p3  ORF type:complete len:106 (-),score=24.71 TRINITY_DN5168_c0_g2_i2:423-740(-)